MLFIAILFLTTLSIAGTAAFFSVYGLAQLFQGMAIPVMIMGGSLEAGKLVAASFLYRYWYKLGWVLKTYLSIAIFLLMVITSVGIFGMLSLGYQTDTLPLKEINSKIELLKQEQTQLQDRKKEIDRQIAELPANFVRGRQKLMTTFAPELQHINSRLPAITTEVQQLSTQQINTQAHVGPIVYIATAFGQEVDDATKYIILLVIIVFDPLAVALTIGVNVALRVRTEEKHTAQPPSLMPIGQPEELVAEVSKETDLVENTPTQQAEETTREMSAPTLTPDEIRMLVAEEVKRNVQVVEPDPIVSNMARRHEIITDLRKDS